MNEDGGDGSFATRIGRGSAKKNDFRIDGSAKASRASLSIFLITLGNNV